MRFFCPQCWSDFSEESSVCPQCGLDTVTFYEGKKYVDKLLIALDHPEPETAERAAWILGELGEERAVEKLGIIANTTPDVFLARAAAEALAKIKAPQARELLADIARSHKARMVREAAKEG